MRDCPFCKAVRDAVLGWWIRHDGDVLIGAAVLAALCLTLRCL